MSGERDRFACSERRANFLLLRALFETRGRVYFRSHLGAWKNLGNKQKEARLILATGHPFPPPPVLGWSLGAADRPSGCALIFFRGSSTLENLPETFAFGEQSEAHIDRAATRPASGFSSTQVRDCLIEHERARALFAAR